MKNVAAAASTSAFYHIVFNQKSTFQLLLLGGYFSQNKNWGYGYSTEII